MDSKTLILAEKPSQARDIAAVLGAASSSTHHIELKSGAKITWARGHLVQICPPEVLNPAWGGARWNWGQLPMIPEKWLYELSAERNGDAQLKAHTHAVLKLIKASSTVIIATDAGREGELIGRELTEYAKFKGTIKRFWTSTLMPEDIKRAMGALLPASAKQGLYEAGRARSHLDNAFGFTASRGVSLAMNVSRLTFPVGRVQSPTLAIIVERTLANSAFDSSFYYDLRATVKTSGGHTLEMLHKKADDTKFTDKAKAEALKARLLGLPGGPTGPLTQYIKEKVGKVPLFFSLPRLQAAANRVFAFTSENTLKIAQKLYDAKFITYPRVDSEHLGSEHLPTMESVLDNIAVTMPAEVAELRKMGVTLRKSSFDDTKLGDHHAIIPTTKPPIGLSGDELQLYRLICAQTLMAVAPDYLYDSIRIDLKVDSELFTCKGKRDKQLGWATFRKLR